MLAIVLLIHKGYFVEVSQHTMKVIEVHTCEPLQHA